jgi:hypothetical protein
MKYVVRSVLVLVLSACVSTLFAQEKPSMQSRPLAEKLSALFDDETLCVVHVDLTQIDTDTVLDNSRAFVDTLFDKAGLTETDRDSLRVLLQPPGGVSPLNWNLSKGLAKTGKAYLVDTLGVREAFLVVQAGGKSFPALVWVAVPKHEKLNVPLLTAALKDKSSLVRETDDFCFVTMLSDSLAQRVNLANVGPNRAAARPEFLEALEVVKDYPIKILVAPPKYVKKVFRETRPTLPGAFEKTDIASMPDALRWKAVGINPEKLDFLAVAEAESENDAQLLYRSGSELFSWACGELIASVKNYKETPRDQNRPVRDTAKESKIIPCALPNELLATLANAYPEIINEDYLKQLGQFVVPKPEGKRFVLKVGGETRKEVVDKASPSLLAAIRKLIKSGENQQRSMAVENQLKLIGLAMLNYESAQRAYPPPFSADKNGKPLQSWRVLILPYMEHKDLYNKIHLDEPWDSEYNRQFHNQMPQIFSNSVYPGSDKKGETNFCMVVGPATFGQTNAKKLAPRDIKDGTSRTIMLIERKTPVCWMAPEDIEQEKAYLGINGDPAGIGGKTPGGVFATFADGFVRFIEQNTLRDKLKAFLTINGGEVP